MTTPMIKLNNGVDIPQLGLGVWQVPNDQATASVEHALASGYRSIDTAAMYRNEDGVGVGLVNSGVPRDQIFVTTKLNNDAHGYEPALRAFDESLRRLKLDYVDLYLIHWPLPSQDRYVETWKAFEKIYAEGRARAIGVSNFQPHHLRRLLSEVPDGTVPALNQIELHPYFQQPELRGFHAENQIATEDWSPLAQGGDVLNDPTITGLADKHGKTPAQVVLRWHIQIGSVVIPKSVTPARIEENIDVFDFELGSADMDAIAKLDKGVRIGGDPDTLGG